MTRSEIFDSYVKSMEEQGFTKKSYPNNDEYKKKLEKNNGRADSMDLSDIEILYGVKPNGKDDETPIDQKAHPKTVVISPSYDLMNGVVENLQERQNIMVDIALKPADGNINNKRYIIAKTNLLNNLVRIGFLMDSINDNKLTVLADSCSETLIKEAGFMDWVSDLGNAGLGTGIGVGAGFGLAALFGGPIGWAIAAVPIAMAIFNNIKPLSQGILNDTKNALVQLKEAQGTVPKAEVAINEGTQLLINFLPYAEQYMHTEIPEGDHSSLDLKDVAAVSRNPEDVKNIQFTNEFITKCKQVKSQLSKIIATLKLGENDRDETNLPKGLDYAAGLVNLYWTPAVKDAYKSLETLDGTLENVISKAAEAHLEAHSTVSEIADQAKSLAGKLKNKVMPNKTESDNDPFESFKQLSGDLTK